MKTSIFMRHHTMFLSGQYIEYQQYSHILLLIYAIEKCLFAAAGCYLAILKEVQFPNYHHCRQLVYLIWLLGKYVWEVYRIATEHHLYNEPLKTLLLYFMRIQMQLILFKLSIGAYGNFLFAS
ncbi:hypothetical protein BDF19DRAFT_445620 [Syncephalis fuscata]|nr:hypothetical protein BDF19DRAFT_445620 [Syncephalis fuscata]